MATIVSPSFTVFIVVSNHIYKGINGSEVSLWDMLG